MLKFKQIWFTKTTHLQRTYIKTDNTTWKGTLTISVFCKWDISDLSPTTVQLASFFHLKSTNERGHKGGKSATMRSWNFVSLLRTNPLKKRHLEQFNLQDKLQPKRKWIHQHHSPTSHEKKYNCSYHFKQQRNFYIQRELELLIKMWLNIISCDNENTSLFHDT